MSTENKNMPRLRFPGFTGEWVEKKLGEVCKSIRTGRLDANAMVEGGEYRFYTCAKDYSYIDSYEFEGDCIMIAGNGAHLGYVHHYNGKFNAYQRTYVLNDFTCESNYLEYCIRHFLPNRIALEKKEGNTPYIVLSTLTDMVLSFPSNLAEQQKIAECLTAIDDLIVAQCKKVDALKEHKKGLMQQLFPQQGETTPRLRFPGFTGEWVEKKLGEVSERVSVGLATSVTPYYRDKGVVMFRNLNIKPGFLDDTDILYLDETFADENHSKKIHTDDVLTVHTGYVGISCVVPQKYEGALTFTTLVTTTKKQILNPQFLCCYLNSTEGAKEIQILQAGGGRNNLNVNDFILFRIPLPPILAEQQKIAECLSTLDEQIKVESAELDALKEHKKGLMQQLFPQPSK